MKTGMISFVLFSILALVACSSGGYDPGETTASLCSDGIDNDGDQATDCDDDDCQGFTFCHVETPKEDSGDTCRDGRDNDGDGFTDCEDAGCKGFAFCQEAPGELTSADCQDGVDNDEDGSTDCDDPDCQGFVFCLPATELTPAECSDGVDNDGDGQADCNDQDCRYYTHCQPKREDTAELCKDGLDNDLDSQTDCADSDCQGFVFCYSTDETMAINCQDGTDNDGDGSTDCADPDCQGYVFCVNSEATSAACSDENDNDVDGLTDCDDPDCQGYVFCLEVENTAAACSDGTDNDSDGQTDCEDTDCAGFTFCVASEDTSAACQDSIDNDSDGMQDCDDPDCQGYVFCLSVENTALSCQDTADNDGDGATDCDDSDCQGFVFCSSTAGESNFELCRDGRDNDSDGRIDCEDDGCWVWAYCNHYHGFPVVDSWHDTWDGLERSALPWQEAEDLCRSLGGRLPTATELWRNNASSGTGDIAQDSAVNYLWTRLHDYRTGNMITVRLSDGSVSSAAEAGPMKFRCIWPDSEGTAFDEYRCHGDPASPCFAFEKLYNADSMDRAPLPYTAANEECNFYGASLPTPTEWNQLIHSGLPNGSNNWLWTADPNYWYSGGYGNAIVRWTDPSAPNWQFVYNTYGTISWGHSTRSFRCIGLASLAGVQAPQGACQGGCQQFAGRASPSVADSEDRQAATLSQAAEDCRAAGGWLPSLREAAEFIQQGWLAGTNNWLWLADTVSWYTTSGRRYGVALARWTGDGNPNYYYVAGSGNPSWGAVSLPTDSRPYRCAWYAAGPQVPDCQPGQVVLWDGAGFACQDGTAGSSNGNANSVEIVDSFGNAWDGIQRAQAATFADALSLCESLGGRLPTASEIFAARASNNPHTAIGDINDTSYLWTVTRVGQAGERALVRVSDGAATHAAETSQQYFRCIWPSSRSDVLGGANCYGPPDSPCFKTADGALVADKYDRVALDAAGAINECLAAGGRLPDHGEVMALMREGWPNGTNAWQWLGEFIYWYNTNYGYPVYRWSGDGTSGWTYDSSNGGLSPSTTYRNFRCVYSTLLK